jgi:hypothetical protein
MNTSLPVLRLGGIPNKAQVGDMGIDGRIFPVGSEPKAFGDGELSLQERWYPIQVKQKDKVGLLALLLPMRRCQEPSHRRRTGPGEHARCQGRRAQAVGKAGRGVSLPEINLHLSTDDSLRSCQVLRDGSINILEKSL